MTDKDKTPMERFEELAKRLFSIAKTEEEKVKEVADEIIEPATPEVADE